MTERGLRVVKVMLVDDAALVRDGLSAVFERWNRLDGREIRYEIVASLPTVDGLSYEIVKRRPDILLLDLDLPGRSPCEAIEDLGYRQSPVKVIILSALSDEPSIRACLGLGVCGYVLKDDDFSAIDEAIRTALGGGRYLSPSLIERGFERLLRKRGEEPPLVDS